MTLHLELLGLISLPERISEIGLVPDFKVKPIDHIIVGNLGENRLQKLIIVGPVSVITWHDNLCSSIGTPNIRNQELEPSPIATRSFIIAEG